MPDPARWFERWETNQIGWHRDEPHPWLVEFAPPSGSRVLVPLCGASVDLGWLVDHGCEVVGVELSPIAARRVFTQRGQEPEEDEVGGFRRLRRGSLTVLVGDYFALTPEVAGAFDMVWDRAAIVAIDPELRRHYADTTHATAPDADMFVVAIGYPDGAMDGPPFCLKREELERLYPGVELLREDDISAEFAERGHSGEFVRQLYRWRP